MAKVKTSEKFGTKNKGRKNKNKGIRLPGEVYTPEEISQLIKACGKRYPTGIRNAGLIATLYGAGLRISEALALIPSDLNLENGTIKVRHGKGDKSRNIAITPDCQSVLEIWLERRKAMGFNGRETVFCCITKGDKVNSWGTPVKAAYVRGMLPRLGKKAGIEKRIHAHGFRHSFATLMERSGKSLCEISSTLGHSGVAVTDKYIGKLGSKEVIESVRSLTSLS
jgi:integrase/recombinase XerD